MTVPSSRTMKSVSLCFVVLLVWNVACHAWMANAPASGSPNRASLVHHQQQQRHSQQQQRQRRNYLVTVLSSSVTSSSSSQSQIESFDEEEDAEIEVFEEIEYDLLTEKEFLSSEWLVGTLRENSNKISETWCRLATDKDGKNVAIWGDGSQGTWSLDVASQFLSMSKEVFWGKEIWAGVIDDYYFVQGTVRGWSFVAAASVTGQWQAKRLGVDPQEAGTPPWFEQQEEE